MPEPIGGVQPFAELARGGATVVYKGYQQAERRFVLLKTVRAEGEDDEDRISRFEEEVRLAARIRHPNVVTVLDAGRDGATAYLVTEFVDGLDLGALIGQGPLPPALAAWVLEETVRGLAAVHAEGILHRDLKPANILLAADGTVKLADFGLASLAPAEAASPDLLEVRGTPAYLAPEVVRGDPPSPASDLFSLGAVLTEILTGRPPFGGATTGETLDAILHHDPIPGLAADPRVPPPLTELAGALLAKDPTQRPPGADAVANELAAFRQHYPADADDLAVYLHDPSSYVPLSPVLVEPTPAREPTHPATAPPLSRARIGRRIAAGVLLLALLGLVGVGLMSNRLAEAPAEGKLAEARAETPIDSVAERDVSPDTGRVEDSERPSLTLEREPDSPPGAQPVLDDQVAAESGLNEEEGIDTTGGPEIEAPEPADSVRAPAEPAVGTLVVLAEPWARVRVDGQDVGTTPLGALTLPAGSHTVVFENPDFPTHTVQVEVEGKEEVRLAVSLWDLVGRVTLVVSPWAEVAVDGVAWDTVPPQQRPLVLTPGEHRLTFTHPMLGTRETTLRIAAGESRTLRIDLSRPSG